MDDKIAFKTETVNKLLQVNFNDKEKTKISNDAVKLMAELLRVFVSEGAARAGQQAKAESAFVVEIEHLEKILPQLMYETEKKRDFSHFLSGRPSPTRVSE